MKKLMILPLLAVGAMAVSWYFFFTPGMSIPSPTPGALSYDFPINGLPALNTSSSPYARYKYIFNPGDGRYIISELPPTVYNSTITYAYRTNGSGSGFYPYSEFTEIYDDKKPPPNGLRIAPIVTNSTTPIDPDLNKLLDLSRILRINPTQTSSVDSYKKDLRGYAIRIDPARRIVSGHGATYVVTFENLSGATNCGTVNSGTIEFRYDPSILDFKEVCDGNNTTHPTPSVLNGTITLPYTNLAVGEQRSIFFIFNTKSGLATGKRVIPSPTAILWITNQLPNTPNVCWWYEYNRVVDSVSSQNVVADSHDPNHKSVSPGNICTNYYGDLSYKVEFQNDGQATASKVTIEDELDFLFPSANAITDIKAYIGGKVANISSPIVSGRKITFTISTAGRLKGKKEAGYGISFLDADTRGHLEFKISAKELTNKPHCNAVCNRARIIFDCNPPIETDLAMSKITCNTCAPTFCDVCEACQDSVLYADTAGIINTITPPQIIQSSVLNWLTSNGYNYFKWYPASGVSNVYNPAATATTARSTVFTLVASSSIAGNCKRFIYHRKFKVNCDLHLTATATASNQTGCPDNWMYSIDANVTGNGLNPNDLVWSSLVKGSQNCTTGTTLHQTNLAPDLYYIAVTDTRTGCYAEQWIDKRYNPMVINDNPGDCDANLIIQGGQPPYTCKWVWNGGNQNVTNPTLNIAGKTGVSVTVTDANQCTAVFQPAPVPGNCQGNSPVPWTGVVIVVAVVIAGGVIYGNVKKK